jgi:hypothetical protein
MAGNVPQLADMGRRMVAAGIPAKFGALNLETFDQVTVKSLEKRKGLRLAREWVSGSVPGVPGLGSKGDGEQGSGAEYHAWPWLFVRGATGRGKTGLGIGVLKALIEQGRQGLYVASFDMIEEMKRQFGGDVSTYTEVLASVDVLMLDELVPPFITDWRRGVLFELLWRRDARRLTTILTTAASDEELAKAVTDAGVRRLVENSLVVRLEGKEIRWGF